MIHLLRGLAGPRRIPEDGTPGGSFEDFVPSGVSAIALSSGRSAIAHLVRRLGLEPGDGVLLPAFIAEGVLQPLVDAGLELHFYRLTGDLLPSIEHLSRLSTVHPPARLAVVFHPFGFDLAIGPIRDVLAAGETYILEDCAQALFRRVPLGDFSLYSFNKFLPVADGAVLVSHTPGIKVDAGASLADADESTVRWYRRHLRLNAELSRSRSPERALSLLSCSGHFYDQYYERLSQDLSPRRPSSFSRRTLGAMDLERVARQREENARYLFQNLTNPTFELVRRRLPSDGVPFCIPALVPEGSRVRLVDHMRGRGVMLASMRDRWDFVPSGRENEFAVELDFMARNVLIPINEFLDERSMAHLVSELNRA